MTLCMGYPHTIPVDQERAITSDLFRKNTSAIAVALHFSGVECHNSLGAAERYHAPLRMVFSGLLLHYPSLHHEVWLGLSLKGMNDTLGHIGFVHDMLMFGALPSLCTRAALYHMQATRMAALRTEREEMAWVVAYVRIAEELSAKLPPPTCYSINTGNLARVYLERAGKWEGPFVIHMETVK